MGQVTPSVEPAKRGYGELPPNRVAGGFFSPGSHSTPHAGPHGALPSDW